MSDDNHDEQWNRCEAALRQLKTVVPPWTRGDFRGVGMD